MQSSTHPINQSIIPSVQGLFRSPVNFCGILDEIPNGVAITDLDFRIVRVNRAFEALTGFSASDAIGVPCRHITRSKKCMGRCPAASILKNQKPIAFESDIINRDRRRFSVRMTLAPIFSSDGTHTGYMETLEDVESIKQSLPQSGAPFSFSDIVGRSPQMEKIFQTIPILSQSDTSILITGETGTGKDLVAEAIHQTSTRASGPFIKINCGALPETLLESEIFGHTKGAFTGAVENKPGRFQLAHNGTIFLTEIGDLPLPLQVKLLTFLDDKVIYPLGSTKGFNADVRMIAATHRNLEIMVKEGKFRQDLFYRLNVARIHLPPLRERDGDIRLLLDHFLNTFSTQRRSTRRISPSALTILTKYPYTGNIRELRNIVEYAVNMAGESVIEPDHLPAYLFDGSTPGVEQTNGTASPLPVAAAPSDPTTHQLDSPLTHLETPQFCSPQFASTQQQAHHAGMTGHDQPTYATDSPTPGTAVPPSPSPPQSLSSTSDPSAPFPPQTPPTSRREMTWAAAEREMILDALLKAKGKKQVAAKLLGWGRTTLWRKMKQHGIE